MSYIGADGCPGGWLGVLYNDDGYERTQFYESIESLCTENPNADRILIDVPIGLREGDNTPRRCDTAAREELGRPRSSSVFPTPIREATMVENKGYEAAKRIQEEHTDGSLNSQTWGIMPKIREVDLYLRENMGLVEDGLVREAHPEICFWAFNDGAMEHSKTNEGAASFWERLGVLRSVEEDVFAHLSESGESCRGCGASIDDFLDAFVLALTALGDEEELHTLPEPEDVERDPKGLPMEMVYRRV